jgi:hypothetical protein
MRQTLVMLSEQRMGYDWMGSSSFSASSPSSFSICSKPSCWPEMSPIENIRRILSIMHRQHDYTIPETKYVRLGAKLARERDLVLASLVANLWGINA